MAAMALNKYANDYEMVTTTDENGREKQTAVYRGDYFDISLDKEGVFNFKKKSLLLIVAIIILHIGSGFVNNQGLFQFYIIFPYVFTFFPLMYLISGIIKLPKEKRKYRRDEIGLSFDRVKNSSNALLILLGLGVIGEVFFLLFFSPEDIKLDYLYLSIQVFVSVAVYYLIRLQKDISIEKSTKM